MSSELGKKCPPRRNRDGLAMRSSLWPYQLVYWICKKFDANQRKGMKMSKRSSKVLKLAHAVAQKQHTTVEFSFEELSAKSYRFNVKPKFQRELTWNLRQKQQFIDSLFSGDPFPPAEGYQGSFTEGEHVGEPKYELGDGQNRFFTVIEFMADKFKTMTEAQKRVYEPFSQVGPVSPGKFFSELEQVTKNWWNTYRARLDILKDREEPEKATRFIRVENHVPLSAAEKLKVSATKARDAVIQIEHHPFWEDFYEGKSGRGQEFQSSLYLLALEMTPSGIVDLQSSGFTQGLIFGYHDDKITDALVDAVLARLDVVSHVYSGAHFTRRIITVAMYQSVMLLEQHGYVIQAGDKGRLTNWINLILDETRRASGIPSYARPIQALASAQGQRAFWDRHLKTILHLFGIHEGAA